MQPKGYMSLREFLEAQEQRRLQEKQEKIKQVLESFISLHEKRKEILAILPNAQINIEQAIAKQIISILEVK